MSEKLPNNKTSAVCFVSSQLKGKKRVLKAKDVVEQNGTSEKETKENKPATNNVSVAVVCDFQPKAERDAVSLFNHHLQQIKDARARVYVYTHK